MNVVRRVYDWFGSLVISPYALWWLIALFFIEASFFFIPVDPLLILFCIEDTDRSLRYAAWATGASVFGGLFGYMIGALLWDNVGASLVHLLISEQTFNHVLNQYTVYQAWAVFIAGFTPVPYKAVTISAGFCKLPLVPFICYSLLARGLRFFILAGMIKIWGVRIKKIIDDYFNYLVIAFTIVLVLSFRFLKGAL